MKFIKKLVLLVCITVESHTIMAQNNSEHINAIVEKATKKYGVPALAVVTMDASKILESYAYGTRIWNSIDSITIDNYFHIGSCSKSVLALIAAKTVEENIIQWDTKFFDIFPELKSSSKEKYHAITLKDLLTCRAGIKAFTSGAEPFPNNTKDNPYEFAKWLLTLDPASSFIDNKFNFHYSNASYTMASLMIQKITNKTYSELVQTHIVTNLGIETQLGFPNKFDTLQPWGHLITKGKYEVFAPDNEYELTPLLTPAGDLSMKPLGFAKYIQLHLKGLKGESNYLNSESLKYLHYAEKGFAIGVVNTKIYGLDISGLDGSAGTFFCRAIIIPEKNFAFTIMTNAGTGTAQMEAVDWVTKQIAKKHFNWWWKFWM